MYIYIYVIPIQYTSKMLYSFFSKPHFIQTKKINIIKKTFSGMSIIVSIY